ncbi:MerR family DNA-binding transcriptional regulator [Streptomyces sp. NPDC050422]|uniref:MerR family DNA-binding transcriptional regulator n=1 Tax=Streptomyces sp. NPDC050422 TaxID=3365614 RepID=UPI0037A31BAC
MRVLIGELSRQTGVNPHQLRYYEAQGLLVPGRGDNGYREYGEDAVLTVSQKGSPWCTAECFQAARGQAGLDHGQVRHWTSWHRHITLAMPALAFVAAVAVGAKSATGPDPNGPVSSVLAGSHRGVLRQRLGSRSRWCQ